jgi:uncharacterized phiE125 gp8 family phage protein
MVFELVTAGKFDAIDLANARLHLKIPTNITAEDDLLKGYVRSATKYFEKQANITVSTSTWAGHQDRFPASCMLTVNKNPVTSITKVEYYNESNVLTNDLVEGTDWIGDIVSWPARIYMLNTPNLYLRPNAVKVTFVAGYSSLAEVDERVKQAIRLLITECEQDRASYVKGNIVSTFPRGFTDYVWQMKRDEF